MHSPAFGPFLVALFQSTVAGRDRQGLDPSDMVESLPAEHLRHIVAEGDTPLTSLSWRIRCCCLFEILIRACSLAPLSFSFLFYVDLRGRFLPCPSSELDADGRLFFLNLYQAHPLSFFSPNSPVQTTFTSRPLRQRTPCGPGFRMAYFSALSLFFAVETPPLENLSFFWADMERVDRTFPPELPAFSMMLHVPRDFSFSYFLPITPQALSPSSLQLVSLHRVGIPLPPNPAPVF